MAFLRCALLFLASAALPLAPSSARKITPEALLPVSPKLPKASPPKFVAKLNVGTPQQPGVPANDTGDQVYWPGIRGYDGPLTFFGGRQFTDPLTIHFLFYGNWGLHGGKDIDVITTFIHSLSDASADAKGPSVRNWWGIHRGYKDAQGNSITGEVKLGEVLVTTGAYKKGLNDFQNGKGDDIFKLVADSIKSGDFPLDANAIYVVMTSADIKVGDSKQKYSGGFCEAYCGWHYYDTLDTTAVTYALIGDPTQCPAACTASKLSKGGSPNGFPGADGAISVLAHEVGEAASDPYFDGWTTDGQRWENGDVCAWTFVDEYKYPTLLYEGKAAFNLYGINGYKYLVQTMPDVAKQVCVVQADSAESATVTHGQGGVPGASAPVAAASPETAGPLL